MLGPEGVAPAELLERNRQSSRRSGAGCGGFSPAERLEDARRALLQAAVDHTRAYRDVPFLPNAAPICMAGHQPELFHAGVWFKNFVLSSLAARQGWVAVNVLIDNDVPRTPAIRVPLGEAAAAATASVPFDRALEGVPYEDRPVIDEACFAGFAARVLETAGELPAEPLLARLWPLARESYRRTANLGRSLAEARHRLEGAWGEQTLEVPLSALCRTATFAEFAAHLLDQLPRLRAIYNRCLLEHRHEHGIRSRTHPVPELGAVDEWLESPFWIWTAERPRREHLFVRRCRGRLLLANRQGLEWALPWRDGGGREAVESLRALETQGVRLRPRALITTMYLRLLLSDLFLHGIGGARYDQLTNRIIASFFGLQAPAYLTVSATLTLFPDRTDGLRRAIAEAGATLRAYRFHPERHVPPTPQNLQWIREKAARTAEAPPRGQGRPRRLAIRQLNARLAAGLDAAERELTVRRAAWQRELRRQQQRASREFSFCLFGEAEARAALTAMAAAAAERSAPGEPG